MTDIFIADYCLRWIDHFLSITSWIIIGAGVLGAVMALVEIYVKWQLAKIAPAPPAEGDEAGGGTPVLEALKGLVEAMAKAPSWIALFIAGIALLWITSSFVPGICRPETKPAIEKPAKAGASSADEAKAGPSGTAPAQGESGG